jgi:hypothetical protein
LFFPYSFHQTNTDYRIHFPFHPLESPVASDSIRYLLWLKLRQRFLSKSFISSSSMIRRRKRTSGTKWNTKSLKRDTVFCRRMTEGIYEVSQGFFCP